jgi:hypothetical protein
MIGRGEKMFQRREWANGREKAMMLNHGMLYGWLDCGLCYPSLCWEMPNLYNFWWKIINFSLFKYFRINYIGDNCASQGWIKQSFSYFLEN